MNKQEINKLIAEKIMGYTRECSKKFDQEGWKRGKDSWTNSFAPASNIEDAWKVIEEIRSDYCNVEINVGSDGVIVLIHEYANEDCDVKIYSEGGFSLPLTLCHAVLKYKGLSN